MKKYAFSILFSAFFAVGCKQADQTTPCNSAPVTATAPDAEVSTLKQYITTNNITATADSRGFYYSIQSPGTGTKPTVCSNVTVNYAGKLTNGTAFDSGNGVSFGLNQLIIGWQEGIPLIAPGGSITLYLPPSLAYGSNAAGSIPANSILIFKIDLVKVN
jgi:FKBP-type peptidyl-prolyl cis-trans isomerase FkpA